MTPTKVVIALGGNALEDKNLPSTEDLRHLTIEQAEKYIEEGHFAPGSMLPKITAAVKFAKSRKGRKAIITSLYKATEALEGNCGTEIEV